MYRSSAADAHAVIAASIAAGTGEGPSTSSSQRSHADTGPAAGPTTVLRCEFESRTDDPELARIVESTVWINEAHPAFRRAVASRSEGYHVALSVAMALGPLAVAPTEEHTFVTAFLSRWGEALEDRGARKRDR